MPVEVEEGYALVLVLMLGKVVQVEVEQVEVIILTYKLNKLEP